MPTQLSITAPATEVSGTPINFTVNALDGSNLDTTYGGYIQITSSDSKAILPVNPVLTGGTGTFSLTLMSLGPQTITASVALRQWSTNWHLGSHYRQRHWRHSLLGRPRNLDANRGRPLQLHHLRARRLQ